MNGFDYLCGGSLWSSHEVLFENRAHKIIYIHKIIYTHIHI